MNEALKAIAEKHGLDIKVGNMTYTADDINVKVTLRLDDAESPLVKAYNTYKDLENLPPINTIISVNGKKIKVVGYNTRARKYPIVIKDVKNHQEYKISAEQLRRGVIYGGAMT